MRRRLVECFAWAQGSFSLDASARPGADLQPFRCDPLRLVRDGIAAHWPLERLLQDVAGDLDAPLRPGPHGRRVLERLAGPGASRLAETLERARTLGEAIQAAGHPEAAATAWVLLRSGGLERCAAEATPAETETLPPEIEVVVAKPDAAPAAAGGAKPGPPHRPDDAAADLRREIEARRAALGEADHYTVLGVARQADAAAVKRAYFAAAKRFHPDALARLGLEDLRATAQQVFARVAEAHAVLADPEQRRAYDASLDGETGADGSRLVQAETLYRKGEVLLRAGRFGDALAYLRPAVELWPEEAEYCAALGWALYKKRPSEPKAALAQLERAAELAPRHSVVRFRLGVVKRALG